MPPWKFEMYVSLGLEIATAINYAFRRWGLPDARVDPDGSTVKHTALEGSDRDLVVRTRDYIPRNMKNKLHRIIQAHLRCKYGKRNVEFKPRRKSAEFLVRVPRPAVPPCVNRAGGAAAGHVGYAALPAGPEPGSAPQCGSLHGDAEDRDDADTVLLSVDLLFDSATVGEPLSAIVNPFNERSAQLAVMGMKLFQQKAGSMSSLKGFATEAMVLHVVAEAEEEPDPPAHPGQDYMSPAQSAAQAFYMTLALFLCESTAHALDARVRPYSNVRSGPLFDRGMFTNWNLRADYALGELAALAEGLVLGRVTQGAAAERLRGIFERPTAHGEGGSGDSTQPHAEAYSDTEDDLREEDDEEEDQLSAGAEGGASGEDNDNVDDLVGGWSREVAQAMVTMWRHKGDDPLAKARARLASPAASPASPVSAAAAATPRDAASVGSAGSGGCGGGSGAGIGDGATPSSGGGGGGGGGDGSRCSGSPKSGAMSQPARPPGTGAQLQTTPSRSAARQLSFEGNDGAGNAEAPLQPDGDGGSVPCPCGEDGAAPSAAAADGVHGVPLSAAIAAHENSPAAPADSAHGACSLTQGLDRAADVKHALPAPFLSGPTAPAPSGQSSVVGTTRHDTAGVSGRTSAGDERAAVSQQAGPRLSIAESGQGGLVVTRVPAVRAEDRHPQSLDGPTPVLGNAPPSPQATRAAAEASSAAGSSLDAALTESGVASRGAGVASRPGSSGRDAVTGQAQALLAVPGASRSSLEDVERTSCTSGSSTAVGAEAVGGGGAAGTAGPLADTPGSALSHPLAALLAHPLAAEARARSFSPRGGTPLAGPPGSPVYGPPSPRSPSTASTVLSRASGGGSAGPRPLPGTPVAAPRSLPGTPVLPPRALPGAPFPILRPLPGTPASSPSPAAGSTPMLRPQPAQSFMPINTTPPAAAPLGDVPSVPQQTGLGVQRPTSASSQLPAVSAGSTSQQAPAPNAEVPSAGQQPWRSSREARPPQRQPSCGARCAAHGAGAFATAGDGDGSAGLVPGARQLLAPPPQARGGVDLGTMAYACSGGDATGAIKRDVQRAGSSDVSPAPAAHRPPAAEVQAPVPAHATVPTTAFGLASERRPDAPLASRPAATSPLAHEASPVSPRQQGLQARKDATSSGERVSNRVPSGQAGSGGQGDEACVSRNGIGSADPACGSGTAEAMRGAASLAAAERLHIEPQPPLPWHEDAAVTFGRFAEHHRAQTEARISSRRNRSRQQATAQNAGGLVEGANSVADTSYADTGGSQGEIGQGPDPKPVAAAMPAHTSSLPAQDRALLQLADPWVVGTNDLGSSGGATSSLPPTQQASPQLPLPLPRRLLHQAQPTLRMLARQVAHQMQRELQEANRHMVASHVAPSAGPPLPSRLLLSAAKHGLPSTER